MAIGEVSRDLDVRGHVVDCQRIGVDPGIVPWMMGTIFASSVLPVLGVIGSPRLSWLW